MRTSDPTKEEEASAVPLSYYEDRAKVPVRNGHFLCTSPCYARDGVSLIENAGRKGHSFSLF
jgi:hypothetical protein